MSASLFLSGVAASFGARPLFSGLDVRLTPGEVGYYPYGSALYLAYGSTPVTDANHSLDVGVGTTKLDPRTVYVSAADFSKTRTNTLYFDLAKRFGDDSVLKLQLFYDDQENKRFVSYGYPAWFDSSVWEARASYAFARDVGGVGTRTIVGAGYRDFSGRRRESFNSGLIALDRRDISFGATPPAPPAAPGRPRDAGARRPARAHP